MGFFDTIFGKKGSNSDEKEGNEKKAWAWEPLMTVEQLEDVVRESHSVPVVIFKHSTRCGISRMAYRNFENDMNANGIEVRFYYLDLLSYREVSNAVASRLGVAHESPQLLLLKDAKVVYHESHGNISAQRLRELLEEA